MMHESASIERKEVRKNVREYLTGVGKRGGLASRRELTRSHAKQMVAIREMKREAVQAGKPWLPKYRQPRVHRVS